jgi:hypothetical protein
LEAKNNPNFYRDLFRKETENESDETIRLEFVFAILPIIFIET